MINNKVNGLIGLAMRAGKVVFGTESTLQEIEKRKVKLIIVANDSAERTKMKFKNVCNERNIPILEYLTIEELSKCIGKDNKAVIGIKESNFSNEIIKNINGGEAIG